MVNGIANDWMSFCEDYAEPRADLLIMSVSLGNGNFALWEIVFTLWRAIGFLSLDIVNQIYTINILILFYYYSKA